MDILSFLKTYHEAILLFGAVVALFWKFADRRRSIHKNQHKILQPILNKPLKEHHDLVLETVFRLCFGETISAAEVRFFFNNKFTLFEIENFCKVREHLNWDETSGTYHFNTWNQHRWFRQARIILYALLYLFFAWLAIEFIDLNKLLIMITENKITTKIVFALIVVEVSMVALAILFLWLGSRLYNANRFMNRLIKNSVPRTS